MKSTSIVVTLFSSSILLAVLHDLAIRMNWYYLYPFVDIPLHVLGGFVIGLFAYAVFSTRPKLSMELVPSKKLLLIILLSTFLVSLLWELLELVFFLTKDAGLSLETLSDIAYGLVGAVIAWLLIIFTNKHKTTPEKRWF